MMKTKTAVSAVVLCCALSIAYGESVSVSQPAHVSLEIVFKGDNGNDESAICVISRKSTVLKCLRVKLDRVLIVNEVPAGNWNITVIPELNAPQGVVASEDIAIGSEERTRAEIPVTPARIVPVVWCVSESNGEVMKNMVVSFEDATLPTGALVSGRTDDKGMVQFYGVVGRSYRLRYSRSFPQIMFQSSPVSLIKDGENILSWKIPSLSILRIRFKGATSSDTAAQHITHVGVDNGETCEMFLVRHEELVLVKESPLLKDARTIKIVLSPSHTTALEVVGDGKVNVNRERAQTAEIVVRSRGSGAVNLASYGPKAEAVIFTVTDIQGRVVKTLKELPATGRVLSLPEGQYVITGRASGFRRCKVSLEVSKGQTTNVAMKFKPLPLVAIQVNDSENTPICGVNIDQFNGNGTLAVTTGKDGKAEIAVDDEVAPLIRVVSREHGAKVVSVLTISSKERIVVVYEKPVRIQGMVKRDKDLMLDGQVCVMWGLPQNGNVTAAISVVKDGLYSEVLQPGRYVRAIFVNGMCYVMDEVVVTAGEDNIKVADMMIGKEQWQRAVICKWK